MNKTGIIFIFFTSNNILCSFTDLKGNTLSWISAGSIKSRGLKKLVPNTISSIITKIVLYAKNKNFFGVHIKIKGVNKNKKLLAKILTQLDLRVLSLQDITAMPHNGCRVRKKRRI